MPRQARNPNAARAAPAKPRAAGARAEILEAAARMMRDRGYSEMSLRDLAAQVGMKAGSLYYHFASKEELAVEVMRLGVETVSDAVSEALDAAADRPARERLETALRVHLHTLLSASEFSSAHIRCYPFVPETVRGRLVAVRRDYDRLWTGVIRDMLGEDAAAEDVRYLRLALIGAMNGALEWYSPGRDDPEAFLRALMRLLPPGKG
ncbi:TetR/AcrR family transcriptional regulator [Roseovarius salinarum]|uniref:TetR/AcrR family transcriptional regulator n=1 Tax=Roseovarius salinarum TaxID=1981892 RepID=UPI000C34950B|nr:TetR/AcrR family transcriptional regulator [Roseovarius salinarum]